MKARKVFALGAVSFLLLVVSLRAETTAGVAASPAKAPEQLKTDFVSAFRSMDETGMNASYDNLEKTAAQDPETPAFAYELARLYSNAAALHPNVMHEEAQRAETLYHEFLLGGQFQNAKQAGVANIEYARFLLATGREDQARSIYRTFGVASSTEDFLNALCDVMNSTIMTPDDVAFWKAAAEKQAAASKNPPTLLQWRLAILRNWGKGIDPLRDVYREAMVHQVRAENFLTAGATDKGIAELRQVKTLLDQYFALVQTTAASRPQMPRTIRPKLILGEAEMWLGNSKRSLNLINEVNAQIGTPAAGTSSPYYGQAKFWQIAAEDHVTGMTSDIKEKRYKDLLATGRCSPRRVSDIAEELVKIAEKKGDNAQAYAYYCDLVKVLPNPAQALWAKHQQEEMERGTPELKSLAATHAPSVFANLFPGYAQASSAIEAKLAAQGKSAGPDRFANWQKPHYDPLVATEGGQE